MGWFSKKEIVSAGVSTSSIVDGQPNIFNQAILDAIAKNTSISTNITAAVLSGFSTKVAAYDRYGKNYFVNGLPEGSSPFLPIDLPTLQSTLEGIVGEPIVIEQANLQAPRTEEITYHYLQDNQDWDYKTNIVNNPPVDIIGYEPPLYFVDSTILADSQLRVEYYYRDLEHNQDVSVFRLFYIPFLNEGLWYHVEYYLAADPTKSKKWWAYAELSNQYPELDVPEVEVDSVYLPIAPIRINEQFVNNDKESDIYKTTKKLVNKLGMNLDSVIEAIEDNPDITNVHEAFIQFATDLHTDNQEAKQYLFQYLKDLGIGSAVSKDEWEDWLSGGRVGEPPLNQHLIQDQEYDTVLAYNYIDVEIREGNIANLLANPPYEPPVDPNDPYERPEDPEEPPEPLPDAKPGFVNSYTEIIDPYAGDNGVYAGVLYERSFIIFRRQLENNQYEQVKVHGFTHLSNVYKTKVVVRNIEDSYLIREDAGFFLPINHDLLKQQSQLIQSQVYYESLKMIFYAVSIDKLKWYQTKGFLRVIQIIVVVVSLYFQYPQGITAALSWSVLADAALNVAINVAAGLLLQAGFKVLSQVVGGKLAIIIAVLAVAIAAYNGYFNKASIDGLPWAGEILAATSAVTPYVQTGLQSELEELNQELEDLYKEQEEFQEEIDAAEDYIGDFGSVDPLTFIRNPFQIIDETPDEFFERTIHLGNPGVSSLDAVGNYVDTKLQLPTIDQTISKDS